MGCQKKKDMLFNSDETPLLLDVWERIVSTNGPIDRTNFIQVCDSLSTAYGDCPELDWELTFQKCDPGKSGQICKEEWLHFLSRILREKKTKTLWVAHDDHTVIAKPQQTKPLKPKGVPLMMSRQVPALLRMKEAMKGDKSVLDKMWGIVRHEDFLLSQWDSSSSSLLPKSKLLSTCKAMAAIRMKGHRAGSSGSQKDHLFLNSSLSDLQHSKKLLDDNSTKSRRRRRYRHDNHRLPLSLKA